MGNRSCKHCGPGPRNSRPAAVVLEELLLALQRLRANRASSDTSNPMNGATRSESLVISIVGSKGGVGCTSLAVNLACSIAQDPKYNVALVDLDLALGDADVALDLIPDYTLADVAMNVDRLDMQFRGNPCASTSSRCTHPVRWKMSP